MTTAPARPAAPARVGGSAATATTAQAFTIEKPKPKALCPRLIVYAVAGYGKTSLGANAPKPVIVQARDEKGLDRLVDSGMVPTDIGTVKIDTWQQLLAWLDWFAENTADHKTLVLDSLGTLERLCHEHVCKRDFNGEWGEGGFARFGAGNHMAVTEWVKLLARLDKIHGKGVVVILLGHSRVRTFKNPMGVDFDRYECNIHDKAWATISQWADGVFFGKFRTIVEVAQATANIAKGRGKGIGADERVIYTQHRDAFDAKPYGHVPAEFVLSNDRTQSWNEVWAHITGKELA